MTTIQPQPTEIDSAVEPSRSWLRFSLATMFVAVTLVAIVAGILSWYYEAVEKRRRALAELHESRAVLWYDIHGDVDDEAIRPDDLLALGVTVQPGADIDAIVDHLAQIPELRRMDFGGTKLTDEKGFL